MLKILKIAALLEGVSSVLLFFVAMPLKYLYDNKKFMPAIGMAHGILFCAFIVLALFVGFNQKWNIKKIFFAFVCAIFPCGTFYFDHKYLKNA